MATGIKIIHQKKSLQKQAFFTYQGVAISVRDHAPHAPEAQLFQS